MMEKQAMGNALVVALSYSEESEHSRRSARMFDYSDIQAFVKNLRRQVSYHLKRESVVSFIAAGEKGDRFGRCHWHVILFSELDLLQLGKWGAPWGPVTDRSEIITPIGAKGRNRTWSLWGHGFVVVQEPDYGGMRYAMAYALKDQFNVRNASGTAREAKAEVFGTGYLGMSKKPPIGARFVDAYLAECDRKGVVPPTRRLSVDGVNRPWWPTRLLGGRLLAGFAAINEKVKASTGRDAAGWSTLLSEARDSDDDLEILGVYDGEREEADEEGCAESEGGSADGWACYAFEACSDCLGRRADLAERGIHQTENGYRREGDSEAAFQRRQKTYTTKRNPLCARAREAHD